MNIGEAIRNTKPYTKKGNRVYEYFNSDNIRFRVIIGNKKNGERVISFFSNRKAGRGNDSHDYIYNQPLHAEIIPQNKPEVNNDIRKTETEDTLIIKLTYAMKEIKDVITNNDATIEDFESLSKDIDLIEANEDKLENSELFKEVIRILSEMVDDAQKDSIAGSLFNESSVVLDSVESGTYISREVVNAKQLKEWIKAHLVLKVKDILIKGEYVGKENSTKERKDNFVAFHFFLLRDIEVMDKVVDAGITVGESKNGIFILTAYGLGHSLDKFWENKAGQHLTRVTDPSEKVQLDSIIPNNEDDVNIYVFNIRDKKSEVNSEPPKGYVRVRNMLNPERIAIFRLASAKSKIETKEVGIIYIMAQNGEWYFVVPNLGTYGFGSKQSKFSYNIP